MAGTLEQKSEEENMKLGTNRVLDASSVRMCGQCHNPVPKHYFVYDDHGHEFAYCNAEGCYAQKQLDF